MSRQGHYNILIVKHYDKSGRSRYEDNIKMYKGLKKWFEICIEYRLRDDDSHIISLKQLHILPTEVNAPLPSFW
jgi:hypothetical protein